MLNALRYRINGPLIHYFLFVTAHSRIKPVRYMKINADPEINGRSITFLVDTLILWPKREFKVCLITFLGRYVNFCDRYINFAADT